MITSIVKDPVWVVLTSPASRTILDTDPRVTFHRDSSSNTGNSEAALRTLSSPPSLSCVPPPLPMAAMPPVVASRSCCFLPPPPPPEKRARSPLLPGARPTGAPRPVCWGWRPGDAGDRSASPRLLRGPSVVVAPPRAILPPLPP